MRIKKFYRTNDNKENVVKQRIKEIKRKNGNLKKIENKRKVKKTNENKEKEKKMLR